MLEACVKRGKGAWFNPQALHFETISYNGNTEQLLSLPLRDGISISVSGDWFQFLVY